MTKPPPIAKIATQAGKTMEKWKAKGQKVHANITALRAASTFFYRVCPISNHDSVNEIVNNFGGPDQLPEAVNKLQMILYKV
jgi:predicted SpoU family rRNA methylase